MFKSLSENFAGEILTDAAHREVYATDASLFYQRPRAIACPTNENDMQQALAFCRSQNLSITARGAGTSTAGQAIGEGLVLDFSRHMHRVIEIDDKENSAWVEPGLVYHALNQTLAEKNLYFPVDPSSGKMCTLGGMVANNASGPHSLKYGAMRDNVLDLRVLLANGQWIETASASPQMRREVYDLIAPFSADIAQIFPKTKVNASGYNVQAAWNQGNIDLTQLFLASEGTLGLISRIKIRLQPLPSQKKIVLVGVPNTESVRPTLLEILKLDPAAVEFYDDRLLEILHARGGFFSQHVPKNLVVLFFIEFDGEVSVLTSSRLRALKGFLLESSAGVASDEFLWQLRQDTSPLLHRIKGRTKPLKFIEDGAVGPEHFASYLFGLHEILERHHVKAAAFGHAGHGHIHINPELDPRLETDRLKLEKIFTEQTDLILSLGGTISGEHGDGLLRCAAMKKQYGPEITGLFQALKRHFDPDGILNPGKKLGDAPHYSDMRHAVFPEPKNAHLELLDLCHGCGKCRTYCPVFLSTNLEITSGRAKANLLRGFELGLIDPQDKIAKETLSGCGSCQICLQRCPTEIDIARLIRENPFK